MAVFPALARGVAAVKANKPSLVGAALLIVVGAIALPRLAALVDFASAYYAKTLCSGVFVKKWDKGSVVSRDVVPDTFWGLKSFRASVDEGAGIATASLFGFARRRALYRPGLGCTLINDTTVEALRAQARGFEPRSVSLPADRLWPEGRAVELGRSAEGVDGARLARAVGAAFDEPDPNAPRRTRAVVIVHKGRIVAERYGASVWPDTPLIGWSLTKSVVNALTGILVAAGKTALDRKPVLPQWRNAADPRREITVEHLMRMTSGLDFDHPTSGILNDSWVLLFQRGDMAAAAARERSVAAPGERWLYAGANALILSGVLRTAVGGAPAHVFGFPRRALFGRIGASSAVLEVDASGTFVGSAFMYASARDWARLGLLFLRDGVWRGERILPPGWMARSRTPTPASGGRYGAAFWLRVPAFLRPEGAPAVELPQDSFYMLGQDGQVVAMFPSRDLVVVRLGRSRRREAWDPARFLAEVLAAVPDGSG